jgi:hypothetical protein
VRMARGSDQVASQSLALAPDSNAVNDLCNLGFDFASIIKTNKDARSGI